MSKTMMFRDVVKFLRTAAERKNTDLLRAVVGEAYKRFEEATAGKGVVYACSVCGCTDIEAESWVPLNGGMIVDGLGEVAVLGTSSEGEVYCQQCQEHSNRCCEIEVKTGVCKYHGRKCVVPQPYDEKRVLPEETP